MQSVLLPEKLYEEIRDIAKKHRMTHAQVIATLLELATKAAKDMPVPAPDEPVH